MNLPQQQAIFPNTLSLIRYNFLLRRPDRSQRFGVSRHRAALPEFQVALTLPLFLTLFPVHPLASLVDRSGHPRSNAQGSPPGREAARPRQCRATGLAALAA